MPLLFKPAALALASIRLSVFAGDNARGYKPATKIPAGVASTNWVHDTATVTLPDGHGLTTGASVDLYWAGGKRCGMTATVTGDSVALAGGHGDALPANGTATIVSLRVAVADFAFAGNNIIGYVASGSGRVTYDFLDSGGTSQQTIEAPLAPFPNFWLAGMSVNPFAGKTVASFTVSNGTVLAMAPQLIIASV